jgi:undecaprenyl-diphosphatase
MNIDLYIFQYLNQFAGENVYLDATAIFFARYLGYFLIFCLLLFLFRNFKKYWPMIVKAFGAAILARFVIANIIKWIWERPRPFLQNQIVSLLPHEATGSFPSGHAVFYFAISTIVYFYNKKIGILFFVGSFLIGLARVFSGVHWPSDILAGALVGIFSGWLMIKILKNF